MGWSRLGSRHSSTPIDTSLNARNILLHDQQACIQCRTTASSSSRQPVDVPEGLGEGYQYTKAGVMLDDLHPVQSRPLTLFEEDTSKRDRLMMAINEVNGRFGKFTIATASQGFKRAWRLRSEMRSPAWTTQIDQVPVVLA